MQPSLPQSLIETILAKLGLPTVPTIDLKGLDAIYSQWCRKVPFDNVRKLIHVKAGNLEPLPGDNSVDFFENWLKYGTGGTCWAGNGALFALLSALGFDSSRGVATMLVAPDVPPNHGTVLVRIDGTKFLVDASILHGRPLKLDENSTTSIDDNAWRAEASFRDGHFLIHWRPMNRPGPLFCRIEYEHATYDDYRERYEQTRAWSPFNYELCARLIKGQSVVGAGGGERVEFDDQGCEHRHQVDHNQRVELLINDLGMSEEIVRKLPEDRHTPPPPWSRTAQKQAQSQES